MKKIINIIFSLIVSAILFIGSIVFILLYWWLMFVPKEKRYITADKFLMRPWTVVVNQLLFMNVKIINKQYVDKKRTTLYICNHQSWMDIQVFVTNSHAMPIAKSNVKNIPSVGLLTIYAGTLFFDQDHKSSRMGIIKDLITLFKKGYSICLYPEGTRSPDGNLLEPNLAVIKLCYKLKIPVVPTALEGTINVLGRSAFIFRFFQKVVLKYSSPLYPADFSSEDDFANACWDQVKKTHDEIKEEFFRK